MAVGTINRARQAEAIIAEGRADLVMLARGMMYDPRWAWHAARRSRHPPAEHRRSRNPASSGRGADDVEAPFREVSDLVLRLADDGLDDGLVEPSRQFLSLLRKRGAQSKRRKRSKGPARRKGVENWTVQLFELDSIQLTL